MPGYVIGSDNLELGLPSGLVVTELQWRAAKYFRQLPGDCTVVRHRLAQGRSALQRDASKPDIGRDVEAIPVPVLLTVICSRLRDVRRGIERLAAHECWIDVEHRELLAGSGQAAVRGNGHGELFEVSRGVGDVIRDEEAAIDSAIVAQAHRNAARQFVLDAGRELPVPW